ncbi:hypothetical protein OG887_00325 [Streptomyces sp. NBC_00053]|uniref:hypothetical protein n=1 Tax=unclassified Streptomyces TaxID=2593676 RepID=UPI00224E1A2E|nr:MULTISPECIES: hypothetical protein [unclassified Streptomyces]MCX5497930.1 hypothetical protein [Streptomyces sp. NBC_00052]MCX5553540.1 hypothetical protein [Streptomyces sp. NBC_00051]WSP51735.1 hypothetical protein OG348_41540 [Streptomyces sp. NBC_01243]
MHQHECSAQTSDGGTCKADLTHSEVIPLPPGSAVLPAQEWVNGLLSRIEAGDDDPLLHEAFTDLTAIAARSLLRAEPGDFIACGQQIEQARQRHGNSAIYAPVDAAVIAGPFSRAVEIVRDPLSDAAFTAIRTLVDREATVMPKGPTEQIRRGVTRLASACLEEQFWRAADPHLSIGPRLRYRTCTTRPRTPAHRDRTVVARTHSLPQLLWLDWALQLFPHKPTAPTATATTYGGLPWQRLSCFRAGGNSVTTSRPHSCTAIDGYPAQSSFPRSPEAAPTYPPRSVFSPSTSTSTQHPSTTSADRS